MVSWRQPIFLTKVNTLLSTVYILTKFYSFTSGQLCIKVANLILCGIALVWFSDDDTLGIETRMNIHYGITIQVSKGTILYMLLLAYCEMIIENTWNEQYNIFIFHVLKHVQQMCTKVYP